MLRKFIAMCATAIISLIACAQDSSKADAFKISGSADVYYRYNFNNPKEYPYNNLTSFTNSHNSFELNMASIKVEHSSKKVDMVADLGFGERAEEFSYNDAGSKVAIKQLYISYSNS
jgi:Putative beta-barrel porin-2, OmpL-like. bbp2